MYLVDTSISSYHQRGHPTVSQRIAATAISLLYTSVVTVEEQFRGRLAVIAQNSQAPHSLIPAYVDLEQTLAYFRSWQVLPFTDSWRRVRQTPEPRSLSQPPGRTFSRLSATGAT